MTPRPGRRRIRQDDRRTLERLGFHRGFGLLSAVGLARIRQLNLLLSLFERIPVQTEVHHEVTVAGRGLA